MSNIIAAVSCLADAYRLPDTGLGIWLMGRLGRAWDGAWLVHGCMDGWWWPSPSCSSSSFSLAHVDFDFQTCTYNRCTWIKNCVLIFFSFTHIKFSVGICSYTYLLVYRRNIGIQLTLKWVKNSFSIWSLIYSIVRKRHRENQDQVNGDYLSIILKK